MTGRNDRPTGPWWSSATDNTAIGKLSDSDPSSSAMHFVKGSVLGTAGHQPDILLDTHYAIHFPGAVEGDYDDRNLSGGGDHNNGASSARVPTAMFEKQLTPSDVGKLNRLVIPKQYAERYFPIDPASDEKGLQLSFEDESGKVWRFRYSYWNSSQSYVLTKGWSRYVKDKRLHASDVVSFHRGDRLYIRYRRSSEDGSPAAVRWGQLVYPASAGPPIFYPRTGDGTAAMMGGSPEAGSKRVVRLFGVNLDCPAVDASQPAWGRGI